MMRMFFQALMALPIYIVAAAIFGGDLCWYEVFSLGVCSGMLSGAWIAVVGA